MRKYFLLSVIFPTLVFGLWSLVFFPSLVYAVPMVGGIYTITSLTISSGGAANSIGGPYSLQIMTGQTVIGRSTGTPYEAQLGGIYALSGTSEGEDGITEREGGEIVPAGTVGLSIQRVGNNVVISWDIAVANNPKIYVLTGNGSGQYDNGTGWTQVLNAGAAIASSEPLGTFTPGAGTLTHSDQVGRGSGEVYYKGLLADTDASGTNLTLLSLTNFQAARAVGKVNISLTAGMNVISVPFLRTGDDTIEAVFPTDLLANGDYFYFKPRSDSPNTEKSTIVGGAWNNPVAISPDFGYWIKTAGAHTLTVWGRVVNTARSVDITENGILVIGTVFPMATPFLTAGFSAHGGSRTGDVVYYKPVASSPNTQKITFNGTNWVGNPEDLTLKVPFGYWYKRNAGNGPFALSRSRP
jgi:hypothetical protein